MLGYFQNKQTIHDYRCCFENFAILFIHWPPTGQWPSHSAAVDLHKITVTYAHFYLLRLNRFTGFWWTGKRINWQVLACWVAGKSVDQYPATEATLLATDRAIYLGNRISTFSFFFFFRCNGQQVDNWGYWSASFNLILLFFFPVSSGFPAFAFPFRQPHHWSAASGPRPLDSPLAAIVLSDSSHGQTGSKDSSDTRL